MKTCPKCGSIYPDMDNFCMMCGLKLKSKKAEHTHKETARLHKRISSLEKKAVSVPKPPPYKHVRVLEHRLSKLENQVIPALPQLVTPLEKPSKRAMIMKRLKPVRSHPVSKHKLGMIESKIQDMDNSIYLLNTRLEGMEKDFEEDVERLRKEAKEKSTAMLSGNMDETNRTSELLEKLRTDFEAIKRRVPLDGQDIKDDIAREFEKASDKMKDLIEKQRNGVQRVEHETAQLREKLETMKTPSGDAKELDTESIKRDLEILKTKTGWLEEQIENLNLKPMIDRINELETDLKKAMKSSPLVLE